MFEDWKHWCDYKNYAWKIVNNCFYWQTNYQTGMIDECNETHWFSRDYFTKL